jgi:hypothetical protein
MLSLTRWLAPIAFGSAEREIHHDGQNAAQNGQVDPQSMVTQALGVLVGSPPFIADRLLGTFGAGVLEISCFAASGFCCPPWVYTRLTSD